MPDKHRVVAVRTLERVMFFDDVAIENDAVVAESLPAPRRRICEHYSSTLACAPMVEA